jgi:hypothetical protein
MNLEPLAEGVTPTPEYQQRVIEEKAQLQERVAKLAAFITSPRFGTLDMEERARLLDQRLAMNIYLDILKRRIACFQPPPSRTVPIPNGNDYL